MSAAPERRAIWSPRTLWLRGGLIAGFVVGLIVTIWRDVIVPENFNYDAIKIQAIAKGTWKLPSDPTFDNVASVYRVLGLADASDAAAILGYLFATLVVVLAVWRSGRRVCGPLESLMLLAFFVLTAAYLGNYSKDLLVVLVVAVLLLLPRALWADLLLLAVILGYAYFFRTYWGLTLAGYVMYRLITLRQTKVSLLVGVGIGGAVLAALTVFVALGRDPDYFRALVNETRSVVATTEIRSFVEFAQPWSGLINVCLSYLALLVPIPLVFAAGVGYLPVVAIFILIWIPVFYRLRGSRLWPTGTEPAAAILRRAVSLLLAVLMVQTLFEPDYGSALRHLTPLLPLAVLICLVMSDRPHAKLPMHAARRAGLRPTDPLLVIHWGQNGGGPRFAVRMAESLRGTWGGPVYTSFNRNAEILTLDSTNVGNDYPVVTYRNIVGLLLGLPRLILIGWRFRRYIQQNRIRVVYSAMLSIWQSLVTRVFLPKDVLFFASIHDAVEHPGDAHWVLRMCRRFDCERADVLVTYSDSARRILARQKAGEHTPILVIPHGADKPLSGPRAFRSGAAGPVRLGFAGRIVEYKGLDLFVDLVRHLAGAGVDVRGIVAGDGDVDQALIDSSSELIDWRVGWIAEADMRAIFEEMDLLILPYREASQSGVYSHALAAGVPSVVTPMGGLIGQVNETGGGLVADAVSAEALAAAVRKLLDPVRYAEISARCIEAATGVASWAHASEMLSEGILSEQFVGSVQPDDANHKAVPPAALA